MVESQTGHTMKHETKAQDYRRASSFSSRIPLTEFAVALGLGCDFAVEAETSENHIEIVSGFLDPKPHPPPLCLVTWSLSAKTAKAPASTSEAPPTKPLVTGAAGEVQVRSSNEPETEKTLRAELKGLQGCARIVPLRL